MYSSVGLNNKLCSVRDSGVILSKVIVVLNVSCDNDGTYYVSDEQWHWTLELKNGMTYYGDSLGWPLPDILVNTVGSNLKRLEGNFGINIMTSLITTNKLSGDVLTQASWFYTLQSCSHVCGVILVCMAAVLRNHRNSWLTWGSQMEEVHVPLLSKRSFVPRLHPAFQCCTLKQCHCIQLKYRQNV